MAFRIIISLLSSQTVWIWKCKDRHIPWHSPGHQAVWILDGTGQCGTSFHTIGFINLTYCKDKQDFTFTVTKSDSKFVAERGHLQHLSPPPNSKRHFWLRICNFFPSCCVNDNNCFPVNDLSLCMYYFCMCACWVIKFYFWPLFLLGKCFTEFHCPWGLEWDKSGSFAALFFCCFKTMPSYS